MIKKNNSFLNKLYKIYLHLSIKRKYQLFLIILLFTISGFAEALSLSAIYPLLKVFTDKENFLTSDIFIKINSNLNIFDNKSIDFILISITLIFILVIIISTTIKVANFYFCNKVSSSIGNDISSKVFRKILNKPYIYHLEVTSSEVILASTRDVDLTVKTIINFLRGIYALILSLSVVITLFILNTKITLLSVFIFGSFYYFVISVFRKEIKLNSYKITNSLNKVIVIVQESFGLIKEIILNNYHGEVLARYKENDDIHRRKLYFNQVLKIIPKYIIEALSLILLAIVGLYFTTNTNSRNDALVFLGIFAFGCQRLLPSLQLLYASYSDILNYSSPLYNILKVLDDSLKDKGYNNNFQKEVEIDFFKNNLFLENIKFKYPGNKNYVINDLSLKIFKGQYIGIIGETGSGKSTIIDIFIGLLKAQEGNFFIDSKNLYKNNSFMLQWRNLIAYVPQDVFLLNASIINNIALYENNKDYDISRINRCIEVAQLNNFVKNLPDGLNTIVGEKGTKLSGGQKQRISIARSLYQGKSILVFDEGTSALDQRTEEKLFEAIKEDYRFKDITLIMISHRLKTLSFCDRLILINKGKIVKDGLPENVISYFLKNQNS